MSITDFKSNFKGAGARPNRFRVILNFPVQLGEFNTTRKASFLIRAASLPASTVGTVEVNYQGRQIKVPGDRTFAEWTVTVLNDTDFAIRDALERWSNLLNSHEGNQRGGDPNLLQTTATVEQLDINDEVLKTYEFVNIYPSEIASIELDFGTNDAIEEFQTTFQYDYWTSDTTS